MKLATRVCLRELGNMHSLHPKFALVLAFLALAGCRGNAEEEPPLVVDIIGETQTRQFLAEAVSAGLTARDSAGKLVPGLAQSWRVSEDGLSIVFRLRRAHFVGGKPVTATDAVYSIRRAQSGRAGGAVRDLLAGVTAVSAPLDDVVEIRLSTPQPEILELLALPQMGIRPRNNRATAGAFLSGPEPSPETGKREPNQPKTEAGATRLKRNPEYFAADKVPLATATVRTMPPEDGIRRFNRGESDILLGGRLDGYHSARVTVDGRELRYEQPRAALTLLINHRHKPLDKAVVRRALQLAVNRQALGENFFGSQAAVPVHGLSPANVQGYQPPAAEWAANPFIAAQEEARRLLLESDIDPLLSGLSLTVAIADNPGDARLIEAVAADFAAVGVDLKLARRSAAEHEKAVASGNFELALVRRETPIDSPLPFLLPNLCNRNRHGLCLEEADKLVQQSWNASNRAERLAALARAEQLWVAHGASIGLVQPLDWALVSRRIAGFSPNASGSHAIRNLSVNSNRKLLK